MKKRGGGGWGVGEVRAIAVMKCRWEKLTCEESCQLRVWVHLLTIRVVANFFFFFFRFQVCHVCLHALLGGSADLCPDVINKAASSSILHDKVEDVVGEVHVQEADDAWMLQPRKHADLILNLVYLGNAAEIASIHRFDCYCLSCSMSL